MSKTGTVGQKETFGKEENNSMTCQQIGWIILVDAGLTKNHVILGETY